MRYVIMANGKGKRWNRYAGITKHHIPVAGETLLARTVRLVAQEDPGAEIIISSSDPSNEVDGARRHAPLHGERELDRFCRELIEDDMCFLYGDTFYSPEAMAQICASQTSDLLFMGRESCIAAVRVGDSRIIEGLLAQLHDMIDRAELPDAKGWTLYHLFQGMPLEGKAIGAGFAFLDDSVMDINSPADYRVFARTHPGAGMLNLPPHSGSALPSRASFRELPLPVRAACRIRSFILRAQGFSTAAARSWVRSAALSGKAPRTEGSACAGALQRRRSLKAGFVPSVAESLGVDLGSSAERPISQRDYLFLEPLNGIYNKWLSNRVTSLRVFEPWEERFEPCHYHIVARDGEPFLIPLSALATQEGHSLRALHALLRQTGTLALAPAAWEAPSCWTLHATGAGSFLLDGEPLDDDELAAWLRSACSSRSLVVFEPRRDGGFLGRLAPGGMALLRVSVLNQSGSAPQVAQASVQLGYPIPQLQAQLLCDPGTARHTSADELMRWYYSAVNVESGAFCGLRSCNPAQPARALSYAAAPDANVLFRGNVPRWAEICQTLAAMCRQVPQVEVAEFELDVSAEAFTIVRVHPHPRFSEVLPFAPAIDAYLKRRVQSKRAQQSGVGAHVRKLAHNAKLAVRRRFAALVAPQGLVPYQSVRWLRDAWRDARSNNGVASVQKRWAYRHGFLSFRIPQYGITTQNWECFISDFEYRWLRHINSGYRTWLEDKVTLKLIDRTHAELYPAYYYLCGRRDGQARALPLMDLPQGYGCSCAEVLRLVRALGCMALKPDEGSHGEGFFKLSWEQGRYFLNGRAASEEEVVATLEGSKGGYLVCEYIQMHPQLAALYPGSVNTVRITVFKADGRTPRIGNAYLRIGSAQSGFVDNVAAGGIVASVDIASGRFGGARRLDGVDQGALVECPHHPDTGAPLEGVIPRWELAKESVLAIARALPQLEYLGFDVAITPGGIKVVEINRFPDFPRADTLEPALIDYLLGRLEAKKARFGYSNTPCRRLLRLPERLHSAANASRLRSAGARTVGRKEHSTWTHS